MLFGLLRSGQPAEATGYLQALLGAGPLGETLPDFDAEALRDSSLRAFLSAKTAAARERGVTLVLGGGTWVRRTVTSPVDVTTVLGNLVDNAVDAAWSGRRTPRRVEVELIGVGDELLITVADSGDGVAPARLTDLFDEGVSTKEAGSDALVGRGVGLPLARQVARARGGDLRLTEPGAPHDSPACGTAAGRPGAAAAGAAGEPDDRVAGGAVFVARLPGVLADDETVPDPDDEDGRRAPDDEDGHRRPAGEDGHRPPDGPGTAPSGRQAGSGTRRAGVPVPRPGGGGGSGRSSSPVRTDAPTGADAPTHTDVPPERAT
ncbi:sensor histidine kinase [Streptomyces similanensis]|uniref:histidine kinase n=1 Tax=Streptomyces similanensis TaxID=1274988 RepID=A0ABP9KDF8_9ACTN